MFNWFKVKEKPVYTTLLPLRFRTSFVEGWRCKCQKLFVGETCKNICFNCGTIKEQFEHVILIEKEEYVGSNSAKCSPWILLGHTFSHLYGEERPNISFISPNDTGPKG